MERRFALLHETPTLVSELEDFLALLAETAGDCFYLGLDAEGHWHRARTAAPSPSSRIMEEAKEGAKTAHATPTALPIANGACHLLFLPELNALLLYGVAATHGTDIHRIVKLCRTLFLTRRELKKSVSHLEIRKNQFDRKFSVLENKYQAILEENEKSHHTILEQQANYSRVLQSEIELQTRQLREATAAAQAANIAKSEFLAAMSHEIRTPMNGIIGFTDILLTSGLTPEQMECALTIKRSGEALLGLINDILDFSKVEAGQMEIESIDFDPEITAHDVCDMIRPRLAGKRIELLCRIDEKVPATVVGDPGRFRQVLLNFLGNAVKFTETGELELSIEVDQEHEDTVVLHSKVRDTGIGIDPAKIELIFEAFKQADGSTTRKYGGTGLGLSICRKIAQLMNGRVWAQSVPGSGSTFHFTAVLGRSASSRPMTKSCEIPENSRILLVDGNRGGTGILEKLLRQSGVELTTLTDERETLTTLIEADENNTPFAAVIIDPQLPLIPGCELARQIRDLAGASRNIPLLAYTSSTEKIAAQCRQSGFDAFLTKPAQRTILLRTLARIISASPEKGVPEDVKTLITQHSIREEIKRACRVLLAEDNPVNQKLIVMMLTKAGYAVEVAENGRLAVEAFTKNPSRYDLILMDIQMPEMDGLAATRQIRGQGFQHIPIIAMTANAMQGDREKCLEAGMNDYISKPIKREMVFRILEERLLRTIR